MLQYVINCFIKLTKQYNLYAIIEVRLGGMHKPTRLARLDLRQRVRPLPLKGKTADKPVGAINKVAKPKPVWFKQNQHTNPPPHRLAVGVSLRFFNGLLRYSPISFLELRSVPL